MKTYSQKQSEVSRNWHLIDAADMGIGRLSTQIATLLMGKHKPSYTPHIDDGDFVVVINSDQIKISGNKEQDKKYYRHSSYPGSLKDRTFQEQKEMDSTVLIKDSVKGMISKNKLSSDRIGRLKVFKDDQHPHHGQNPTPVKATEGDK